MSRCFPFPPPGYESKGRSDHIDFLAKEKHKEKKHKKEKKDKEKREGKERKDKEKSKDKHKEKKDRKEKHKDKKKDKDRDKDKGRSSEDRRTEERIEGHHEVRLGDGSQGVTEVKDFKFTEELGKRIRNEEKGAMDSMAENFAGSFQRRVKGMCAAAQMEKGSVTSAEMLSNSIGISERRNDGMGQSVDIFAGPIQRIDGVVSVIPLEKERGTTNNSVSNLIGTEKRRDHGVGCTVDKPIGSMQERFPGRPIAIMEKASGANKVSNPIGTMAPNVIFSEQRRNHGMGRPVDNIVPRRLGMGTATATEKERGKNNNTVSYLIGSMQGSNDGMVCPEENLMSSISTTAGKERGKGTSTVGNLIGTVQRRNDGLGGSLGKDTDKSMEGNGKTRDRENNDSKGGKNGDRDQNEKKNKGKHKGRHKEKEKEKTREKGEYKPKMENDKLRDNGEKDMVGSLNIKPLVPHKDNVNTTVTDGNIKKRKDIKMNDGNIKKRKDIKMNGFLHENDARPNKFLRTSSPSHLPLENGRTLESCHITAPSILPGAMDNIIAGLLNNEHKINGITEPPPLSVDLRPVALDTSDNKVHLKPPHPDSKYLSQIYSVPKMEELPEFDDQEWLFSNDNLQSKPKAKTDAEETSQVWAEAMQLESADVVALPYVIPF